jgi:thymidylate synthase (FAD)
MLGGEEGRRLSDAERRIQTIAREIYEARLAAGVAREQARKDLPLSTYTEAYWKIDLHNLLHFLGLRMAEHAQQEIRAYANVIGEKIVAAWVPTVWDAFLDYRMHAIQLSRNDQAIIVAIHTGARDQACDLAAKQGMLKRDGDAKLLPNRERVELESKLRRLGLAAPWS